MVEKKVVGRPRGSILQTPAEYKNRFQKFYYLNRERLNTEKRERYEGKKERGLCVRCEKPAWKNGLFCKKHLYHKQPVLAKILQR